MNKGMYYLYSLVTLTSTSPPSSNNYFGNTVWKAMKICSARLIIIYKSLVYSFIKLVVQVFIDNFVRSA